jgi:dTDP-4-amino-4,6-dideoxygalactose transaminase
LKVPVFDITRQNNTLEETFAEAFQRVLNHGQFILGKEVELFEEKMAQYLDAGATIGLANGSDALLLSLLALGIGDGDEVIVPGFTFFATAGAVSRTGATPVFVDVAVEDYTINPEQIVANITDKTKAIIPVHLFGMPAAMEAILKIAGEHQLAVVEDCAQALGSTYDGQPVGTLGDAGCFSFFPTKNLGAFGDAGMVSTNRDDLAETIRMLRVHGAKQKYHHELLGFNSRLDALQAALLKAKLPYLNQWIKLRRKIAATYRQELQDVKEIRLPGESEDHTYNQFTITTPKRDGLRNFLKENGVETTIYYPLALHLQPVYRHLKYKEGSLPVSEKLTRQVLSLPIFPELTEPEQSYVINKIKQFFAGSSSR